jgi:AcrR family transcriptional regulator
MARTTYHHGDLRRALSEAALELVRSGGPDAVTIREVARRLEVSPAAIYRHFPDREALLGEVARLARLALTERMLRALDSVDERRPRARAVGRFLATGRGYLEFAADEPHLLEVAFLPGPADEAIGEQNPWHLLGAALDGLVAVGAMRTDRRAGAEVLAWSTVHGFATLRANQSFEASGDPSPDPETLLDAIARSLDVDATAG